MVISEPNLFKSLCATATGFISKFEPGKIYLFVIYTCVLCDSPRYLAQLSGLVLARDFRHRHRHLLATPEHQRADYFDSHKYINVFNFKKHLKWLLSVNKFDFLVKL